MYGLKLVKKDNAVIQVLLSAVTIAYFSTAVAWLSPDSEPKKRFLQPVEFWMKYFRLDQSWNLFSPKIRDINYHTIATITFRDGTRMLVEAPRMSKLGIVERFQKEKIRKVVVDSLPWPDFKEFWPDYARWVGRQYYVKENEPRAFSLQLKWIEMPAPDKELSREQMPEHTKTSHIFYYQYQPGDFE